MDVNAAPPVQLEQIGVQTLRIVPLADGRRVNRRLVVDGGTEILDIRVSGRNPHEGTKL